MCVGGVDDTLGAPALGGSVGPSGMGSRFLSPALVALMVAC